MSKIRILPDHEARKIAAGEVVERPASVVKELLENALDAQATAITVLITNGGKSRIEIRDNGCGMSPDDVRLCSVHHATSKLESVDQLSYITTFGFRGEALASIAAVSTLHIITRRLEDEVGIHITLDAGVVVSETAVSANVGTTIIVEDLFFNIPARRKFMKQRDTEWRAIHQLICATALVFPEICFTVLHDGQQLVTTRACTTMLERAEQVFGQDTLPHLIPITSSEVSTSVRVEGIITTHQYGRYDRRHIFCFVNRRWVKNHVLGKALLAGYNNVLPAGKFPVAVVSVTIPVDEVDINIHPRKEEVMLLHPQTVSSAIQDMVNRSLHGHIGHQFTAVPHVPRQREWPASRMVQPDQQRMYGSVNQLEKSRDSLAHQRESLFSSLHERSIPVDAQRVNTEKPAREQEISLPMAELPEYEILGQFAATYVLVEISSGLMLIDQHAAHECVIYQRLVHKDAECITTKLLFPEFISLAEDEVIRILPYLDALRNIGIEAEVWGHNQVVITATSVLLNAQPHNDIIMELLKKVEDNRAIDSNFHEEVLRRIHALISCKAAVKAGDLLSRQEQQSLVASYLMTEKRLSCPHGRPTSWLLSHYEFERTFKRVKS